MSGSVLEHACFGKLLNDTLSGSPWGSVTVRTSRIKRNVNLGLGFKVQGSGFRVQGGYLHLAIESPNLSCPNEPCNLNLPSPT